MIITGESNPPSSSFVISVSQRALSVKLAFANIVLPLAYDPFLVMQDQNKVYGFTISLFEYIETIPTLWDAVKGKMMWHEI